MASVKKIKKDINCILGDLIGEVNVWELENPNLGTTESDKIIDEIIILSDQLISKVNQKGVSNKKEHFSLLSKEIEEKVGEIADKINKL